MLLKDLIENEFSKVPENDAELDNKAFALLFVEHFAEFDIGNMPSYLITSPYEIIYQFSSEYLLPALKKNQTIIIERFASFVNVLAENKDLSKFMDCIHDEILSYPEEYISTLLSHLSELAKSQIGKF